MWSGERLRGWGLTVKMSLRIFCAVGLLLSWALGSLLAGEAAFPLVQAVECSPRAGWPNFLKKAGSAGAEVKVAYLGGSITAQPGWRVLSLAHFQKRYPLAKFREVNAAIGGTGSDLGVFRLKSDVLVQKPDLLFVEFAVNDGGAQPEQIQRCMEGIVRQTWAALPGCDICFVYTVTEALVPALLEGKFQRSASAMEAVAGHYGIPSIHLGLEVARLAKAGKLVWAAPLPQGGEVDEAGRLIFAPDTVHPHVKTGHRLYMEAIMRSVPGIDAGSAGDAVLHELKVPLRADHYEGAQLLPITAVKLSAGFSEVDVGKFPFAKTLSGRLPALRGALVPGESLEFKFKGRRCAVYQVIGPRTGQVTVTVDGKSSVKTCFDPHCKYYRLGTLLLADGLEEGVHSVKVEVHAEQPDRVAILAKNKNVMGNPADYEGTAFFPGALLLLGELVE